MQTWPAPGNPGAPTYWPNTERVGFFDTPTVDHDNDHQRARTTTAPGAGKLTYIGGHSFSTSVPYAATSRRRTCGPSTTRCSSTASAVAKLDLTYSPTTYPQNGTEPLSVSIVNTGGSVATDVGNVSITLAPGFTLRLDDVRARPDRRRADS